jgi:hypothetical protein
LVKYPGRSLYVQRKIVGDDGSKGNVVTDVLSCSPALGTIEELVLSCCFTGVVVVKVGELGTI